MSFPDSNPFVSKNERVIVIMGATATGKTAIAEHLSELLNAEIISADSRQIYKHLKIGTAKPDTSQGVIYHLTDFLDPDLFYSASSFLDDAKRIISDILSRGKTPIIAGGTGFYIRALTEGIFEGDFKDDAFRQSLYERSKNGENLHFLLKSIDPMAADKIHPNNIVRVIRALEVFYISGKTISEHWVSGSIKKSNTSFIKILINRDRDDLKERIRQRTIQMLSDGWIEEVTHLKEAGYKTDCAAFNSVGYPEILSFLTGTIPNLKELNMRIYQKTWQYARRQLVWFAKEPKSFTLDVSSCDTIEGITLKIFDCVKP